MGLFDFIKKAPTINVAPSTQQSDIRHQPSRAIQTNEDAITLESRIRSAFPSKNGLYPHEILMLDYASSYKTGKNSFQNFWKCSYSVLEPQKILDSLYKRGFLCRGDAADALKRMTVADLKAILEKVGEKATGKKDDLIKRILKTYSAEALESAIPERYYALTDMGVSELKQNEYVPYLHRHPYMSVWEMNIMLHTDNPSHLNYRDILWRDFNRQSAEHFQNFDFGLYRNIRLDMHNFLLEENKYKTALHLLIEVISFDLSGLGNGDNPTSNNEIKYESKMSNLLTTENGKEVTLAPGIIKYFENIHKGLEMPPDEFIQYTYKQFSKIHIHDRVFTDSECANIILSEIGLEERIIKNSYKVAEQRLKKKFLGH